MRTFTVWGENGEPGALSSGTERPKTADGSDVPNLGERLWTIDAATYEEAMAIYNLRCGHEPYLPSGQASPCPRCGALIYARGSGQCWRCE